MCSNYAECFSVLMEKLIENMKSETFFVRIVKVMIKKQKTKEKTPGSLMLLSEDPNFKLMSEKEMIQEHPLYIGDDEALSDYEEILSDADWPIYQQKEEEKLVRHETSDLLEHCNYPGIYIIFGCYKDHPRIPLYLGSCNSMRDRGFLDKHGFSEKFVNSDFWHGKCGLNEEYLTLSITMIGMDKSIALLMEDVFLRVFDFSFNKRNNNPSRYDKYEFIHSIKEDAIKQASDDDFRSKEKEVRKSNNHHHEICLFNLITFICSFKNC